VRGTIFDMKIAFCGHSHMQNVDDLKRKIVSLLRSLNLQEPIVFLLGGYGRFDSISLHACQEFKEKYTPSGSLCFVSPYNDERYYKSRSTALTAYDEIIYPEIERTPRRYAILQRNKWMARNCDILICYVKNDWGGAFFTLREAKKRQNCRIFNLADRQ